MLARLRPPVIISAFRRMTLGFIALLAGGLVGAAVSGIPMLLAGPIGWIVILATLPFWLIGGVIIGAPVWWIFARIHRTQREDAALAGFVASTVGSILGAFLIQGLWPLLIPVPIAGTVAGYIVHKVYYL